VLFLHPSDAGWPSGLGQLPNPPAVLRVRGTLPGLRGAIAVVGTRAASEEAIELTHAWCAVFAREGRAVISGGALGIDAAAHRGALSAGGATVAVLPSGFAPPYPERHGPLFDAIACSPAGALVSEQPDGFPPRAGTFLARNRLIAALAESVLVVEAPIRSGALSTAAVARRLEKPVWAVPHAPWEPRGAGFSQLVRLGARICTSPRDVLSLPALEPPEAPETPVEPGRNIGDLKGLDEAARAVLAALSKGPRHPDALATELSLPLPKLLGALLELELLGRIESSSVGTYRLPRA
jgi:DNA processing protein